MQSVGYLEANFDALEALFQAIVHHLHGPSTRLALWLIAEVKLSRLQYQSIGAKSPFASSGSTLAGDGILIACDGNPVELLGEQLGDRLTYEILHLEIEVNGEVQFAAYDHFGCVLFGAGVPVDLLKPLRANEVICHYEIFSKNPPEATTPEQPGE